MKYTILFLITLFSLQSVFAELIIIDFSEDVFTSIDGSETTNNVTTEDLTITLTPSDNGALNVTERGLGIDSGTSETDDVAGFNIGEYLILSFDKEVIITSIQVSSWSDNEAKLYTSSDSDFDTLLYTLTGDASDLSLTVEKSTPLKISSTEQVSETNGWILESITVETIPEPTVISLLFAGGIITVIGRRFRP